MPQLSYPVCPETKCKCNCTTLAVDSGCRHVCSHMWAHRHMQMHNNGYPTLLVAKACLASGGDMWAHLDCSWLGRKMQHATHSTQQQTTAHSPSKTAHKNIQEQTTRINTHRIAYSTQQQTATYCTATNIKAAGSTQHTQHNRCSTLQLTPTHSTQHTTDSTQQQPATHNTATYNTQNSNRQQQTTCCKQQTATHKSTQHSAKQHTT